MSGLSLKLLSLAAEAEAEAWKRKSKDDLRGQVQLPSLYPLQEQIKAEATRFNVPCIGRRAGKTYLCTHLALETALAGHPVGWFVPDYKVALEVWRDIARPLKGVATKQNATERRIELPNGGVIEVWTLENEDAGRGRKYKRVIVDEAAMAARLEVAWEQAISPTLVDLVGDAWFPSTPKGLNYYYKLFQRGSDPLQTDWKSWQLPSGVNPFLPASEIERARLELPEMVFKQEYLAEFISGDGAVFRNVDACLNAPRTAPRDHVAHIIVAGVDLAQKHDFTAVSIYCCTCNHELALDRWNQLGWDLQRGRLVNLLIKWGVDYCLVELNSIGQPNFEALLDLLPDSVALVGFETTSKSKPKLIRQAMLAFEREDCQFLPDQNARHEILAYECEITATGYPKYGAPDGGYDDTVMARALALEAKAKNPLPEMSVAEQRERLLPDSLKNGAVQERLSQYPPAESWRALAPRALALAELKKQEEEKRRQNDVYGAFDLL